MDPTTSLITIVSTVCVGAISLVIVVGAFYGLLVLLPRYQNKKVENLKAIGKQGEATIIGLPEHELGPLPGRSSMYTLLPIKLEIRVPGIETYVVEKTFTFPTGSLGLLKEGKVVAVWVDPKAPRDLSKIVIHVNP